MNIAEIREFLEAHDYKIAQNWHDTDIWRKSGGEIIWECQAESYNEALKRGLNHWLSEQLGIHWQRLWAWQALRNTCEFFYDALDAELMAEIEKAIAWHEALEKEAE